MKQLKMSHEDAFIVKGGIPLKGDLWLSGAKNVALKVIIASLLFENRVILENIPKLKDVDELCHVLELAGVRLFSSGGGTIEVHPDTCRNHRVDLLHGSKTRVSFMLFAPFLFRFGKAVIPNPGGCRIGARPIDRIVDMMRSFGVVVAYDHNTGYYAANISKDGIRGTRYTFSKPTHTGTELAIMFAVRAKGESCIENSALEPEIDDLINFLNNSGGNILRKGRRIVVHGVPSLKMKTPYQIMKDRIEAVTFASFALATRGDITVKGVNTHHLESFLKHLENTGAGIDRGRAEIRFFYKKRLNSVDITTSPYPGFSTDWQAPWAVLMTQATGNARVHETVFENRFGYVSQLKKLGAKISFIDPMVEKPEEVYQFDIDKKTFTQKKQHILIKGVNHLHGGVLRVSDLRAGATLLIGACTASKESVILGASIVDRGYEAIEEKLKKVGADIVRV